MKSTSVRSSDQRRMLQANSHSFPSNAWIHKIKKETESDKCDLCKSLWIAQGRFNSEKDLPVQTLGHIQHTCEALSTAHIDAHHQCWRLIHGELARLAAPGWKFLCISGEKCLQTLWNDIPTEIEGLNYLNLTRDTIWNHARDRELKRPLSETEEQKIQEGQSREAIAMERFWRLRPDGIAVLPPVGNKAGVFCILEHKRMSDVCDQYVVRAKREAEDQYASFRKAISATIGRTGWQVEQISFITGARSVNKKDFSKNMKFFKVPEASIQSVYSKLTMRVFDVYANILKCMYSSRFSGGPIKLEDSPEDQSSPITTTPLLRILDTSRPDKHKRRKKECQEAVGRN